MKFGQALYNYTLNSTGKTQTSKIFDGENITEVNICPKNAHITKLGIRADSGTEFNINGNTIMIGNSCLYEVNDVIITELYIITTPVSQIMINYVAEEGGVN